MGRMDCPAGYSKSPVQSRPHNPITCQDFDLSGYRLLMPFDYTLSEEEKTKWAGKLTDKQIVIGVRELVPFGGRLRARGARFRPSVAVTVQRKRRRHPNTSPPNAKMKNRDCRHLFCRPSSCRKMMTFGVRRSSGSRNELQIKRKNFGKSCLKRKKIKGSPSIMRLHLRMITSATTTL
jgi:hypothetical protein